MRELASHSAVENPQGASQQFQVNEAWIAFQLH